jgi:phenylacetate-coenzyme A ligase PaaK-like adenylate-forming protein
MGQIEPDRIFGINSEEQFQELALEVFQFQAAENPVYKAYLDHLGILAESVTTLYEIPFLPIELFKQHRVITGECEHEEVFESSGTTGENTSKHYICDLGLYRQSFTSTFKLFYGDPKGYCILALLPSYLERQHSSLVYMAKELIGLSGHPGSGFYLDDLKGLIQQLETLEKEQQPTLLLGVSFALLDLADALPRAEAGIHPFRIRDDRIAFPGLLNKRWDILYTSLDENSDQRPLRSVQLNDPGKFRGD